MTTVLSGTLQIDAANALPVTTSLVIGDSSANTSGTSTSTANRRPSPACRPAAMDGPMRSSVSTGTTGMLTVNYQGNTPMVYTGARWA